MQAIQTKFLPATSFNGSRIKASCERGSIIVSYDHAESDPHIAAAQALVDRFVAEDSKRYGTNKNPWSRKRIVGGLPDGTQAHVFVD